MRDKTTDQTEWKLPPAEPSILRNLAGYFTGLQKLKGLATNIEEEMEDKGNIRITDRDARPFITELKHLSDHLDELAHRMEDDNFFSVSPGTNPPFEEAKERALSYVKDHPGAIDAEISWLLRCTEDLTEKILVTLQQEGKILKKGEDFYAR